MGKAHLKSDKPPPKTLIYQGFENCILNEFKMLGGKRSQKSPLRDFFDKLQKNIRPQADVFLLA